MQGDQPTGQLISLAYELLNLSSFAAALRWQRLVSRSPLLRRLRSPSRLFSSPREDLEMIGMCSGSETWACSTSRIS